MTFDEAEKALLEIAQGQYCTLSEHRGNWRSFKERKISYEAYIHGSQIHKAPTWEEVLELLKKELKEKEWKPQKI